MVKKRISNREARGIARKRMNRLMDLATVEARADNLERSRRYVTLARNIGMRTNAPMLKKRLFCHECMLALVPGHNCRVRLRSNRISVHCLVCDHVRRVPYLNEKRGVDNAGKEKQEAVGQDGVDHRPDRACGKGRPDRGDRGRGQDPGQET